MLLDEHSQPCSANRHDAVTARNMLVLHGVSALRSNFPELSFTGPMDNLIENEQVINPGLVWPLSSDSTVLDLLHHMSSDPQPPLKPKAQTLLRPSRIF
jgi:hypothetical protein